MARVRCCRPQRQATDPLREASKPWLQLDALTPCSEFYALTSSSGHPNSSDLCCLTQIESPHCKTYSLAKRWYVHPRTSRRGPDRCPTWSVLNKHREMVLPASGESAVQPLECLTGPALWPVQAALPGNPLSHTISIQPNSLTLGDSLGMPDYTGGRPGPIRVCP